MPDVIEFNYPPVDATLLTKDLRRRQIPAPLIERVRKGTRRLEDQIKRVERDTAIRYPPTIVLPCALFDIDNRIVVDAHVTIGQKGKIIFLQVRFAAPTVALGDDKKLLGIAAHEFIHYVAHTISIYQHAKEHGTLEGMSIGEVPSEVKARGIRARDEYHTVAAKDWLNGKTLEAWEVIEQESFTVSKWADLIMKEWINKGYPTEDFKRGSATRPERPGRLVHESDIIDKAEKLGLIA
jgi:hypothetical protein